MSRKIFGILSIFMVLSLAMTSCQPQAVEMGELVPPVRTMYPNQPQWIEFWRPSVDHFYDLGIELKLEAVDFGTLIDAGLARDFGNLWSIDWIGTEESIDPFIFFHDMLHSSQSEEGGFNVSMYVNSEFDDLVDQAKQELDRDKRQELIWQLQEIIERDVPIYNFVFPDVIQPYNSAKWSGVVPRLGAGIARTSSMWTYLNIEPLTDQTELRVGWMEEPLTMNPLPEKGDAEHIQMTKFIYDTLAKLSADLEVVPWAAESWKWQDDLTLDVVIRDDMLFHDGLPVTVEDVKFTFDYLAEWDLPYWAAVTRTIESVEIIDDRTVRITLPEVFTLFEQNILTRSIILPKHIWENIPESVDVDQPENWEPDEQGIGSGPFKYGYWERGQEVFLESNPDHFSAPKIDGLHWITVPSLEGLLGQMETQELDMINFLISPADAERLAELDHITAVQTPNHGFYVTQIDIRKAPFDDVNFRRAINLILNRQQMLNDVFGGAGEVARGNSPVGPSNEYWHNPDLEDIEFSIEQGRQILEDAGYTWDEDGRLHYPATSSSYFPVE